MQLAQRAYDHEPAARQAKSESCYNRAAQPTGGPLSTVLALQRRAGNRAAGALLQQATVPVLSPARPGTLQRRCACGGTPGPDGECAACRARRLARQHHPTNAAEPASAPPIVHDVLRAAGQPLDPTTRAFMEPRFGRDFGAVRVHTDARAAASAQAIDALAYTVGRDVVFDAGQYAPATTAGKRLLAHELAHTLQQSSHSMGMAQTKLTINTPGDALEREANHIADAVEHDGILGGAQQMPVYTSQSRGPISLLMKGKKTPPPKKEKPPEPEATEPSPSALKALEHAKKQLNQTDPAIWFDSWGNDLRDNNLSGKIDEKKEQGIADGTHYGKDFNAKICKSPGDTTDKCPASDQSAIKVRYKVCIDIPIEAYKAAKVSVSTSRWIPTFFGELQKRSDWTVWKAPARPAHLLDGDIVAAANKAHQHAGIVETGTLADSVINLPGPSAAQKYKMFKPSGTNDMVSVPRVLFEAFLSIDWIARPKK